MVPESTISFLARRKDPALFSLKTARFIYIGNVFSLLKRFFETDVVMIPGGSVLQTKSSARSLVYYLFLLSFAIVLKKKLIVLSNGVGPISASFLRPWCAWCLQHAHYFSVRDEEASIVLTQTFDKKISHSLDLDLGFYQTIVSDHHFDPSSPKALVIHELSKESLILSDSFQKDRVFRLQASLPCEKEAIVIDLSYFDDSQKGSQLSFLISYRYHACIWAVCRGIPFVAIGDDPKLKGIASQFSQAHFNDASYLDDLNYDAQKYYDALMKKRTFLLKNLSYEEVFS
tara:strand:- start:4132 stop:4992 length:861 start_codon:yes stop_codon:yes gene_type:complete